MHCTGVLRTVNYIVLGSSKCALQNNQDIYFFFFLESQLIIIPLCSMLAVLMIWCGFVSCETLSTKNLGLPSFDLFRSRLLLSSVVVVLGPLQEETRPQRTRCCWISTWPSLTTRSRRALRSVCTWGRWWRSSRRTSLVGAVALIVWHAINSSRPVKSAAHIQSEFHDINVQF